MSLDEDTGEVIYRTRPSRTDHPEGPVARWDVYELIGRVLDHLPAPRQQQVRYWGYYSNVSRVKRRAALPSLAEAADPADKKLSGAGLVTVPAPSDDEPFRRRARQVIAGFQGKVCPVALAIACSPGVAALYRC